MNVCTIDALQMMSLKDANVEADAESFPDCVKAFKICFHVLTLAFQ